jgi:hypothetical protein
MIFGQKIPENREKFPIFGIFSGFLAFFSGF